MLVIENAGILEGDSTNATEVDYTVYGLDNNIFTFLANGQLANSKGTIYTANSTDIISTIILVNTGAAHNHVNLYIKPTGGTSRRLIPKDLQLEPGYSLHFDGKSIVCMDANGQIVDGAFSWNPASPPEFGITTPNTFLGKTKEIYKTSSGSLTAAECSGTTVSCLGLTDAACDLALPTAVEGLAFLWILPTERAQIVRLRADTNDCIYLVGVHGSNNGYIGFASGWVHGTCCSMFTFKNTDNGYDWFCFPLFGLAVAS